MQALVLLVRGDAAKAWRSWSAPPAHRPAPPDPLPGRSRPIRPCPQRQPRATKGPLVLLLVNPDPPLRWHRRPVAGTWTDPHASPAGRHRHARAAAIVRPATKHPRRATSAATANSNALACGVSAPRPDRGCTATGSTRHHHRPPPPTATTWRASLRHQAAGILAGDCSTSTRSGDRAGRCCSPIELDPDQSTWPAWPPPQRRLGPPADPQPAAVLGEQAPTTSALAAPRPPHQGCHTLDDRFCSQDAKVLRPPVQAPRPTPTPNAGWHGPATCLDWLLIVGEVTAAAAPGRRQAPPPASSHRALG